MTYAKIFLERAGKTGADQIFEVLASKQNLHPVAAGFPSNARMNDGYAFAVKQATKTLDAFPRILTCVLKPANEIRTFRGQGKGDRDHFPAGSRSRRRRRITDPDLENRALAGSGRRFRNRRIIDGRERAKRAAEFV